MGVTTQELHSVNNTLLYRVEQITVTILTTILVTVKLYTGTLSACYH